MSCPNPIELSRALVTGVDDRLQAHLDSCARCTAQVESHANIADDLSVLPVVDPAPDHAHLVRTALLTAARSPALAPARPRMWMFGFAAAGALAAAAIVFVVIREPSTSKPAIAYRGSIHAHAGAQLIRVGGVPDEIVRLTQGTITVEVSPLAAGERFRVITADGEVEVHGTAFDVTADADHLTAVRVLHGRVEVRASGAAPRLLDAGERWDMKLAAADTPTPAPTTTVATSATADQLATDLRAAKPAADIRATKPADKPAADIRATKPADKPAADIRATKPADQPAQPAADRPADKHIIADAKIGSTTGAPKRPIEVLFEQGWAALAAGNPGVAATAFERAATSAPNDPLAEDAWFWRASALARAKSTGAAGALEQFLARYPRSNRAGEASAVLGWIVIASDLDRAEKLFETATKDRVPAVRASAEKGLAAVGKQRGRRPAP